MKRLFLCCFNCWFNRFYCFIRLLRLSTNLVCDYVANLTLNFGTFYTFFHYHPPVYYCLNHVYRSSVLFYTCTFVFIYCVTQTGHQYWSSILFYTSVFYCVIHTDREYWSSILFFAWDFNCVIHIIVTYYISHTLQFTHQAFTLLLLCLLWVYLRPLLAQYS